jgi:methionyl-tRNA formyltransferase
MSGIRIAFAGDRDISVHVLEFILSQNIRPVALLLPEATRASHAGSLLELCSFLEEDRIFRGHHFLEPDGLSLLRELRIDYLISVHFPYIFREVVLSTPRIGVLNLHPAFLPYNRGWHTPSWAILEDTPVGATLHFVDLGLDTGDIIYQRQLDILPGESANTLYQRLKKLEFEVFKEAWPHLVSGSYKRQPQNLTVGTFHKRRDLFSRDIQRIELDEPVKGRDLIRRLRALTTNSIGEAAYYEENGKRYRLQIYIQEEPIR